jgi:methylated-DNA-[protein]-cysteine S-methyltransferase
MRRTAGDWMIEGDEWWPVETPVGRLTLAGNDAWLHNLYLPGTLDEDSLPALEARRGRPGAVAKAEEQLLSYFAGELRQFDLPLEPRGTDWQRKVWRALSEIPFGQTESYGGLAGRVGNARASRAVGLANNRNPVAVIIPCHRVIGASGDLTGYGGGLPLKAWLLAHEREVMATSRS